MTEEQAVTLISYQQGCFSALAIVAGLLFILIASRNVRLVLIACAFVASPGRAEDMTDLINWLNANMGNGSVEIRNNPLFVEFTQPQHVIIDSMPDFSVTVNVPETITATLTGTVDTGLNLDGTVPDNTESLTNRETLIEDGAGRVNDLRAKMDSVQDDISNHQTTIRGMFQDKIGSHSIGSQGTFSLGAVNIGGIESDLLLDISTPWMTAAAPIVRGTALAFTTFLFWYFLVGKMRKGVA